MVHLYRGVVLEKSGAPLSWGSIRKKVVQLYRGVVLEKEVVHLYRGVVLEKNGAPLS